MTDEFKTYYEFLKKELNKYRGSYDYYIFSLPDIFRLLCDLLNTDIDKEDRRDIACALGYFVAPKDLIQEEVYGPAGYVDDLFLCCYVLNKINKKHGIRFLKKYWKGEDDFEDVFKITFRETSKIVENEKLEKRILKYVGLI